MMFKYSYLILFLILSSSVISQETPALFVKHTSSPINIDGADKETVWESVAPTTSFWQWRPTDSIQARKQTEYKVLMDDENLYILVKAYTNGNRFLIPSLKRDFDFNTDYLTLFFDTFNDATNAFSFSTNPMGVKAEGLISGGNNNYRTDRNYSWDTRWDVETTIHEGYFMAEFKIPFQSVNYEKGTRRWRFNITRRNTEGNEHSTWIKTPQNLVIGNLAFMGDLNFEKPLVNPKVPLSLIPYVNGLTSTEFDAQGRKNTFLVGGDMKIPIGNSLNVDLTINPDFSQVEVDDQVVNLTRFEISLPEKRQFFTQNSDLFSDFGNVRDALPFFSRRIGVAKDLEGNTIENKIISGVRLSGKLDKNLRIGFMSILTEADEENEIASNFNSLLTLRQKVFNRSNVAFFLIDRRTSGAYDFIDESETSNSVMGLEYNLASADSKWNGRLFLHKSQNPTFKGDDLSSGLVIERNTRNHNYRFYGIFGGENFKSDLGFYRRTGFMKFNPNYTYRIYPKNEKIISMEFQENFALILKPSRDFLTTDRLLNSNVQFRFLNQSNLELDVKNWYRFLDTAFDPTQTEGGLLLPADVTYNYTEFELSLRSDRRKKLNLQSQMTLGSFYNGKRFSLQNEINWRYQPYFVASFVLNYNNIQLPEPYSSAQLWLISPKLDFSFTKKLFWTTYVQFNSQNDNLGINSRVQWRFAPLSDLYFVYNDNYLTVDTFTPRYRSFNLKLTYWLNI